MHYRLDLEYDGSDFHGWQVQPGLRTVQGELQRALEKFLRQEVQAEGAGRTDAGVHALGQVASFECSKEKPPERLLGALHSLLPRDILVRSVRLVAPEFSARHSAVARSYRFRLFQGRSALWRRFCLEVPRRLDVEAMDVAARQFLGEHDFRAFAASSTGDSCTCLVERAGLRRSGPWIEFDITANRFVHNMVRRLTGVLLEVGRGRLHPGEAGEILRSGDRRRGGPCLPPQGLFLLRVRYPGEPPMPPREEGMGAFGLQGLGEDASEAT
jgi:tRNA pseudouridine38-40 synthase